MLKLLIKLWWLQQRRNFHKRDVVVGCYILFVYIVVGVSFYHSFTQNGGSFDAEALPTTLGAWIAIGMLLPDIIMKMVMKRDITAMDDYVKSRPVPEKIWNRFLLLTNLVSFWNYVLPVLMIPVFIFLLPSVGHIVASFLLLLVLSYVNGIYVTCYRKAAEFMLKWPLVLGWLGMLGAFLGYMVVGSFFTAGFVWGGLFLLVAAVIAGLVVYLYNLKNYNEQKRKVNRFRGFKGVNLFSLQYVGTMRAKRIRNMVLIVTAVFLFDAYMFALMPAEATDDIGAQTPVVTLYVVGAILLPSVVLSQWTFGIEANYFQGLITKPVKIEEMLRNCFYYYMIVSAVALLFVLPFLWMNVGINGIVLAGGFCLAVFINLFNLPTCLFSSRLEIFSSSMFSMQGANMKINLYAAAFLVPLGAVAAVYYFFGNLAWAGCCFVLALASLALHKWFIAKIAVRFYKNRYKRMEKFMEN